MFTNMMKVLFCWCMQWIFTIKYVGIAFTHTLTLVLDIDDVGIIFQTF